MRKKCLCGTSIVLALAIASSPTICAASASALQPITPRAIPSSTFTNRQAVLNRLIKLGIPPALATREVALLKPNDLATLAANPHMVQRAGDTDPVLREAFWGCVALGAVAAIIGMLAT